MTFSDLNSFTIRKKKSIHKLLGAMTFISISVLSHFAYSGSNDNLNIILELESKITQKVKSIVQPADPDAIVLVKIEIKKINTELAGTPMSAIGIFSTSDVQSVEDGDIQSVSVSIISTLEPFPKEIKDLVDTTIKSFSKKGQIKITRMSETLSKSIQDGHKNKMDLIERSKSGWQKAGALAEELSKLTKEVPNFFSGLKTSAILIFLQILLVYSLIQGAILFFQKKFQGNSIKILKDALSSISINSTNKSNPEDQEPHVPIKLPTEPQSTGSNLSGSITTKDNPIEQMYIQLIRDLLSDCYWCQKDHYAAWVWSQLSPPKRMELLESWEPLIYYVKYFTHLEPKPDNYHLDPVYLKPREYFMHSNDDLLAILRANPYLWSNISIIRQKAFKISLKERIDFMNSANKAQPDKPFEWPYTPSKLRVLHTQLEVSELSNEDESLLFKDPNFIPNGYRDSLHSLTWCALLPLEERDKLLQKLPAQVLAEIWIGPEEVLAKISEALPAKKQELLKSYLKKVTPQRTHPGMKYFSDLSLKRYRELNPIIESEEEVVIPVMNMSPSKSDLPEEDAAAFDVDALVASFKNGGLDESNSIDESVSVSGSESTTESESVPQSNSESNSVTNPEANSEANPEADSQSESTDENIDKKKSA